MHLALYLIALISCLFIAKRNQNLISSLITRILCVLHFAVLTYQTIGMNNLTRLDVFSALTFSIILCLALTVPKDIPHPFHLVTISFCTVLLVVAYSLNNISLVTTDDHKHLKHLFVHINFALIGYASFFFLSISSLLYLWVHRILKTKNDLNTLQYIPNLLQLDFIQRRSLFVGIIVFTLAIGLGKMNQPNFGLESHWGTKEILSVIIWTFYAFLATVRFFKRIPKHTIAFLSCIGLFLICCSFFFLRFSNVLAEPK